MPPDCVALAFMGIVEQPIDMVVSGINQGANLGHDVTYSGTVTAAMESRLRLDSTDHRLIGDLKEWELKV